MARVVPINSKTDSCSPTCGGHTPFQQSRLRQSSLLTNLTTSQQDHLLMNGTLIKKRKGEYLFMEGDNASSIYFIISGKVKEYYLLASGNESLRQVISSGHYVSMHHVFDDNNFYPYSCEALNDVLCYSWRIKEFRMMMNNEPLFSREVAKVLSFHVERFCRHTSLCSKVHASSRVATFLLSRYNSICNNNWVKANRGCNNVLIDLRPLTLTASEIFLARETFSRMLSSMQKQGLIKSHKGIVELLDIEALKCISGDYEDKPVQIRRSVEE